MRRIYNDGKGADTLAKHMSDDAFAELKEALEDALAYESGKRQGVNVTKIRVLCPSEPVSDREI